MVSNDADLVDDVLRLAAANGIEVHLATDAESARSRWQLAPLVLVGADTCSAVIAARMARRRDVVLVTREPTPETWQEAVALGAEHVVCLPDAERWLIDRLAESGEAPTRAGRIVSVIGSGAGAGASTFAVTLALAAASKSMRVLLVDADPLGGGLDVILGMEEAGGIRWPDLVETRGRLGASSLDAALPHADGVALLSWGREGPGLVAADAMSTVLDAGTRGYDLVVVDLPRHLDAVTELVLSRSDETILVTINRVRSAAAAARLAAMLDGRCGSLGLVLRTDPKGILDEAILSALDVPVIARIPAAPGLAGRADDGEPPGLRDAYGKACLSALRTLATSIGRAA